MTMKCEIINYATFCKAFLRRLWNRTFYPSSLAIRLLHSLPTKKERSSWSIESEGTQNVEYKKRRKGLSASQDWNAFSRLPPATFLPKRKSLRSTTAAFVLCLLSLGGSAPLPWSHKSSYCMLFGWGVISRVRAPRAVGFPSATEAAVSSLQTLLLSRRGPFCNSAWVANLGVRNQMPLNS